MPTVTEILIENVSTGEGKRGPWAKHKVALDDGQEVFMFAPVAPGDEVEARQNGEYTNWYVIGDSKGQPAGAPAPRGGSLITNDQIYALLAEHTDRLQGIEDLIVAIAEITGVDVNSIIEKANAKHQAAQEAKPELPKKTGKPDVDEPINLEDIPF